jgi:hypothetical protein
MLSIVFENGNIVIYIAKPNRNNMKQFICTKEERKKLINK